MKLVIQKRKQFIPLKYKKKKEYYFEYIEFELETFRWNKNHTFEYVAKHSNMWKKLEDNEEIVGLGI